MTCLTCVTKRLETSRFFKTWPDSVTLYVAGGTCVVIVASKTTASILDLFEKLNDQGLTLVVVTHDETVARRAKRRVSNRVSQRKLTHRKQALGLARAISIS